MTREVVLGRPPKGNIRSLGHSRQPKRAAIMLVLVNH